MAFWLLPNERGEPMLKPIYGVSHEKVRTTYLLNSWGESRCGRSPDRATVARSGDRPQPPRIIERIPNYGGFTRSDPGSDPGRGGARRGEKPKRLDRAICHLPSAICHLPSAICHLPFAICYLPSASAIRHPQSPSPPGTALKRRLGQLLDLRQGLTPTDS